MKNVLVQNRQRRLTIILTGRYLLYYGILSTAWYIITNIIVPAQYAGYNISSQTVSELSAIDSPTRTLWIVLCSFYTLLLVAFGIGVWLTSDQNKKLRFVATIIIFDAVFGIFWPPMHQREVIAAGGGTTSDTLHIIWTFIHLLLVLLMIGFGAAALGKGFRIYSIVTVVLFIVFGILTSRESHGIDTGQATPYIGIWERINMGAYMLWIVVFAIELIRRTKKIQPLPTGK
jgi:hypothetical protein